MRRNSNSTGKPVFTSSGRIRDFPDQWFLLADVDDSLLQPARRARRWMQVRGPYRASDAGFERTKSSGKPATEAIIRVVDDGDLWKLEHIRVH